MTQNESFILLALKYIGITLELIALIYLFFKKNKLNKFEIMCLSSLLLFQFIGDVSGIFFSSYKKTIINESTVSLIIHVNYRLILVSFCILIFYKIEDSIRSILFSFQSLIAYLIIIPPIIKFSVDLINKYNQTSGFLIGIEASLYILIVIAFAGCLISLTSSTHTGWSNLSGGLLIACFTATLRRYEESIGHAQTIVFYEYIWTIGLFLQCYSVTQFTQGMPKIETKSSFSYLSIIKIFIFGLISIAIISIAFFQNVNKETLRITETIELIVVLFFISINYIYNKSKSTFIDVINNLENTKMHKSLKEKISHLPNEYKETFEILYNKFEAMYHIQKEQESILKIESEIVKAKQDLYKMISHDIRSPLKSINNAISNAHEIKEITKISINKAAKRLNQIAENILENEHINQKEEINSVNKNSVELVTFILQEIVIEKTYEYTDNNIEFKLEINDNCYNIFSKLNPGIFKRVISNIINNSAVSTNNRTVSIKISIKSKNNIIEIEIEDNGSGIPDEILSKVKEKGFSYNKKDGSGLGLYYANEQVKKIGGTLEIESKIDIGTKITITLNQTNSPDWFCNKLNISQNSTVMVLDDDLLIHDMWKERFIHYKYIKVIDIYSDEFLNKNSIDKIDIFLIDYQLSKNSLNGLELIKKFSLTENSYLVTNNFEDVAIRKECNDIGLKIIPKPYVPHIDITFKEEIFEIKKQIDSTYSENQEIIISILDDEDEVLQEWKSVLGIKNVFYFLTPDDFINEFINDSSVGKTTLIISDYYFNNTPVTKLLDFVMLKDVLGFNGKIFLFSSVKRDESLSVHFDFIFPNKNNYYNKSELNQAMLNCL